MMTMAVMNGHTAGGTTIRKSSVIRRTFLPAFLKKAAVFLRGCLKTGSETRGVGPVNETEELFHRARCMGWAAAGNLSSRFIY